MCWDLMVCLDGVPRASGGFRIGLGCVALDFYVSASFLEA